jgi:hypothetical protein
LIYVYVLDLKTVFKGVKDFKGKNGVKKDVNGTGKSLSEALIFASTNPHHEIRLFIEIRLQ